MKAVDRAGEPVDARCFLIRVSLGVRQHQGVAGCGGLFLGAPDHREEELVGDVRQKQSQRLRALGAERPGDGVRVVAQSVCDRLNVLLGMEVQPAGVVQCP